MSPTETTDTYHGDEAGDCPDCSGTGYNHGAPGSGSCPHCEGTGSRSAGQSN